MVIQILLVLLLSLAINKMWSDSDIFRPLRNFFSDYKYLRKPFLCSKCMSFWFGFICSLLVFDPFFVIFNVPVGFSNACFGLICHHITCFLVDKNLF